MAMNTSQAMAMNTSQAGTGEDGTNSGSMVGVNFVCLILCGGLFFNFLVDETVKSTELYKFEIKTFVVYVLQ